MRPKGSAEELERRRRQAIALLGQGMQPAAAARAVGASRSSVTRWRQTYQAGGKRAMAAKPHPGGVSKLTAGQRARLGRMLLQGPGKHGYATELWTLARVTDLIAVTSFPILIFSLTFRLTRRVDWRKVYLFPVIHCLEAT